MRARIVAVPLWFLTGWFVGAILAFALGISPILAPVAAVATAALFAGDPRHVIWRRDRV